MQVMSEAVKFTRAAQRDFDEAIEWYEKRSSGLGVKFTLAVRAILERIGKYPELYAVVESDVRQAIVLGFPYSILYRIRARDIAVVAVFHSSRDPAVWQRRL